ncbi:diguanylate cyclase [uncultured Ferrimonas sp.]|uniref:diguanylate cyclase n=1 Tax=uncultured Ferrimonas sp. TaxID=432640 RepID=UPI002607A734|nr:diguanylate cyclase [uncultured Ferrimonas sp.]
MAENILIVEDQPEVVKVLRYLLNRIPELSAKFCLNMQQANQCADTLLGQYKALLVEYKSLDNPQQLLNSGLPTIVFLEQDLPEVRKQLLSDGAVDVIVKEGLQSYQFALSLMLRLLNNPSHRVLVVDDSATIRRMMCNLLLRHRYQICEAEDGEQALAQVGEYPDISLVITDYQMPNMDGITLVQQLRKQFDEDQLCVIGLSSANDPYLSSNFIKNGANDFLHKPFVNDEFYCRIHQSIERIERVNLIRDMAEKDVLTGLYNRRYFFDHGNDIYQEAKAKQHPLSVAVVDVDFFKKVNDTYGHNVGDEVLQALANTLKAGLDRFLLARTGGEEFFIVMEGMDAAQAELLVDTIRHNMALAPVNTSAGDIRVTFSAGVTDVMQDNLTQALAVADQLLYDAKELGRNQVVRSGCFDMS